MDKETVIELFRMIKKDYNLNQYLNLNEDEYQIIILIESILFICLLCYVLFRSNTITKVIYVSETKESQQSINKEDYIKNKNSGKNTNSNSNEEIVEEKEESSENKTENIDHSHNAENRHKKELKRQHKAEELAKKEAEENSEWKVVKGGKLTKETKKKK